MATTQLTSISSNTHRDQLLDAARRGRSLPPPPRPQALVLDGAHAVTIRYAGAADAVAVSGLAELDGAAIAGPEILVAEVGGAIVAALAVTSGVVVADPFRRTCAAVDLMRMRAEQLGHAPRHRHLPRFLRRALTV
jgi:hypothetical protein